MMGAIHLRALRSGGFRLVKKRMLMRILLALAITVVFLGGSSAQEQPFRFTGAACVTPPPLHCPDADCASDRVINQGSVVEMQTRRTYFLDYPCDLKPGEKVTFILSL